MPVATELNSKSVVLHKMGRGRKEQSEEHKRPLRSMSPGSVGRERDRSRSPVRDSVGQGGGKAVAIDVGKRSVSVIKFTEEQLKGKDIIAFTQTAVGEARAFMQKTMDIGTLFGAADGFKRSAVMAHEVAKTAQKKFADCALEPVAQSEMQSPLALANKELAEKKADLDYWTAKQEELQMSHTALKAESDAMQRALGPQPYYGDYETTLPKSAKESRDAMERALKK